MPLSIPINEIERAIIQELKPRLILSLSLSLSLARVHARGLSDQVQRKSTLCFLSGPHSTRDPGAWTPRATWH